MSIDLTTPEYLRWSEVPITFNCSDHPNFVPKPGRYPLIVSPIIKDVKLNQVFVDGGSSLNILFLKTFNQMDLPRLALRPFRAPFHGFIPGSASTPIDQITLSATLGTRENYHTEYLQFEVANFEMTYNRFLGRPGLTKFMAIPHYAYLVLKMSDPNEVITVKGDAKQTYDCDQESPETADSLLASIELQNLKKALAESPLDPMMSEAKLSKLSIQVED
jgi:hypothetical protein